MKAMKKAAAMKKRAVPLIPMKPRTEVYLVFSEEDSLDRDEPEKQIVGGSFPANKKPIQPF